MTNIVNGKLNEHLYDSESIDIGNGFEIKCKWNGVDGLGLGTNVGELNENGAFDEIDSLPEGAKFKRLLTRRGPIAFVLDNVNKMLDDFGTLPERREETINRYFEEAKDFFLEKFVYIDPKIVIVAPNGEVIEPDYDNYDDRPILRSDDEAGILASQNYDVKFIENNIGEIVKDHYESKIESAEESLKKAKSELESFERNANGFSFGKKAPSGPGM